MTAETVEQAFPELDAIGDDELREGVVRAWRTAIEDTGIDDFGAVQWAPPIQRELGIDDERLVAHVRDVTVGSIDIAEMLIDRRDADLSLDTVVAGALVHDVSKPYEYSETGHTRLGDLLGHPYYGIHVVSAAGLPAELAHVVLSHSHRTAVEPATLEAAVITSADRAAAAAIRATALDDLRDA